MISGLGGGGGGGGGGGAGGNTMTPNAARRSLITAVLSRDLASIGEAVAKARRDGFAHVPEFLEAIRVMDALKAKQHEQRAAARTLVAEKAKERETQARKVSGALSLI